jgi:LuxR family maltose regulon positive regulatory protein
VPEMRPTFSSPERARQGIPLLATKLHVPLPRPKLVTRPRLVAALDEGLSHRLILVAAPAGFGKTTLLSQWIATRGVRCAWLSLDAADNDPTRFCTYAIGALQRVVPGAGQEVEPWLHAPQPPPVESILTPLINDLYTLPEDVVLVLDDYHAIDAGAVHHAITYLLDQCPPPLHVMIATRADPPLPFARWRARGQMAEVRADDLRFTSGEVALFCDQMTDARLAEEDLLALEARTEGWAVGLQMAALSLQGREDAGAFIRSFSGSHRYVLDYLVEEVLDRQPEEVQTFLLRTSILGRLCGALCDAVLEQAGSQAMLERVEKANLFLVALDDERRWYRYHHLFAELLRAQLQRSLGTPSVTGLHVRAAEWHAQCGSIQEAIHHASEASDDERLERFMQQHYMELVSRGEQSWLRSWTGSMSRTLAHRRPWLCIYEAYSHSWFGELDEADRLLEEAERRMRSEGPASDARSMQALSAYVKSRVTAMRGEIDRAIELCLEARELAPGSNLALQLDSRITLGYEYFMAGDYVRARPTLEEMVRSGTAAGAVINPVAASCILARLHAIQGRLRQSYETYQVAARMIPDAGEQHRGPRALLEIGLAEVCCEWNDLDAALLHVQQGLGLMPFWDKADDWVLAYVTLACIYLAQGNRDGATEAVENAVQMVQTRGVFPEARRAVEVAQARVWLAQGDLRAAGRWAASQEERLGFERELAQIARARVWIAEDRPAEAVALLSRLQGTARSAGRMGRVIEILLLEALARQKMGDSAHAIQVLTACLALAEPEGYVRVFLDEGAAMAELLHAGLGGRRWDGPRLAAYAKRLLAACETWAQPADEHEPASLARGPAAMIEPLSERELEVLRMVVEGLSNQEIAERLIIAIGTVKAHVHHIYGKLEVGGRVQAVARARELDLL